MARSLRTGSSFFSRLVDNIVQRNVRKTSPETLVGVDYKGNRYFEQVGGSVHERKLDGAVMPKRWFLPSGDEEENWDNYVPPEWEAWLRYRRTDPPTEDEINKNLAVAYLKQVNAAKLEASRRLEAREEQVPLPPASRETALVVDGHETDHNTQFKSETGDSLRPKFPVYKEYEGIPGQGISLRQELEKKRNPFID